MLAQLLCLALMALPKATAHGGVLSIAIGSTWYKGWTPYNSPDGQTTIIRPWATYDPIQDATASTVSCNDDGTSGALQLTAPITAGQKITGYWNVPWPHPYGPMLVYMAQCPGSTCTGVKSQSLKWFKIDQSGLVSGTVYNGVWGSGLMIQNNNSWTSTVPSTIPNGPYLIRFETIALHSLPAQLYPECAQLMVSGGSGSRPPTSSELVSFPGGYSNSDPGLTVDIYSNQAQTQTTYPIPGPPLYGSPPSTTTVSSKPSTGPTTSPTSSPTSSPTPTGPTVPQYGQCGGTGYTGSTTCASPYKCNVVNAYYSQCL